MDHFNWSAIAVIVGLSSSITALMVGIVSYFVKKWMTGVEAQYALSAANISEVAKTTAAAVAKVTDDNRAEINLITLEIKQGIRDSRDEHIRLSSEIKASIDKLSEHQAIANGRTGKIEGAVREISARCEERSRAFYKGDA